MFRFKGRATVFDRPAYITIINNTNMDLILYKKDVYSGKLELEPPKQINAGESGKFQGMNVGLTGSRGLITYKAENSEYNAYVSLYWAHPEAVGESRYYGYSSEQGIFHIEPVNDNDENQKAVGVDISVYDFRENKKSKNYVLELIPTGHSQHISFNLKHVLG